MGISVLQRILASSSRSNYCEKWVMDLHVEGMLGSQIRLSVIYVKLIAPSH